MPEYLSLSPAEAVENGAQLLDEKIPGWWRIISLEELHLASCTACICGQIGMKVFGMTPIQNPYGRVRDMIGLAVGYDHGFASDTPEDDSALEAEWEKAIRARLEADKLAKKRAPREELVLVG